MTWEHCRKTTRGRESICLKPNGIVYIHVGVGRLLKTHHLEVFFNKKTKEVKLVQIKEATSTSYKINNPGKSSQFANSLLLDCMPVGYYNIVSDKDNEIILRYDDTQESS